MQQKPLAFVRAFADLGTSGSAAQRDDVIRESARRAVVDDPATSPWQIWRPEGQYPAGFRVVWHGQVYEARSHAAGVDASLPSTTGSESPSSLLGAVTTTESAPKPVPTVTDVTSPWDSGVLYQRGDRVVFDGLPYEARWADRGEAPSALFPIAPDKAWGPLFTLPGEPAGT